MSKPPSGEAVKSEDCPTTEVLSHVNLYMGGWGTYILGGEVGGSHTTEVLSHVNLYMGGWGTYILGGGGGGEVGGSHTTEVISHVNLYMGGWGTYILGGGGGEVGGSRTRKVLSHVNLTYMGGVALGRFLYREEFLLLSSQHDNTCVSAPVT